MMRIKFIFLFSLLCFSTVLGQKKNVDCDCPNTPFAGTKADTSFHLSNGKTIVLCGYKNPESKPATYSEFVLAACGQGKIIDFWSAVLTCRIKTNEDTLLVDQLQYLPTGENLNFLETVWATEKIYFTGQKIVRKFVINRQIRKYTQAEIQTVLKIYETEKAGFDDNKMIIVYILFIATISGDNKARQYFRDFKSKYGTLDGAYAKEYEDLTEMLKLWDNNDKAP